MKRLLSLLLLVFLFVVPQHVFADNSWDIENFNSQIVIQESGIVQITETISVDFHTTPEHGIYRDIPYIYTSNGKQTYTDIQIKNIFQNNEPIPYTTSLTNGYEEVKIGDPTRIVEGRNVYRISYSVTGILARSTTYDDLYWNVTGNNWPVEIQKVEATVTLPQNGISQILCYEGTSGSFQSCQSMSSQQSAFFETTRLLQSEEGLTIAVAYKKGLVPLLIAQPPSSYWEKLLAWPSVMLFIIVILIGVGGSSFITHKSRRTYAFMQKNIFNSLEFSPPEKLRPAEIGVLIKEKVAAEDIVATIIDLAQRGYITIAELPKKWEFGNMDYLLTKSSPKERTKLLRYEQLLLDTLFYKRRQIKLSTLTASFSMKEIKQALYRDVVEKKFLSSSPGTMQKNYVGASVILLIGGLWWIWYGFSHTIFLFGDVGVGFIVDSIIIAFVSLYIPKKTTYGRTLYRRLRYYYFFIDTVEKYKQYSLKKANLFNDNLPYAIMFGLTNKFTKQMKKIGVKPTPTEWYVRSQSITSDVLNENIGIFLRAMSKAMEHSAIGIVFPTGRKAKEDEK